MRAQWQKRIISGAPGTFSPEYDPPYPSMSVTGGSDRKNRDRSGPPVTDEGS
jgi:hypothetical protein